MSIDQAIAAIEKFQGDDLTESLSTIETDINGWGFEEAKNFCDSREIDESFMASALSVKKIAGQINVIIHAAGILHSLQHILEHGEKVEYVSLGAGNAGRDFDLETNRRIAEYKFIDWQGGAESIRQNGVFKDFFELAEKKTEKKKFLYVVGTKYPILFFQGGRALTSVLSRHPEILEQITSKYGTDIKRVCDYYDIKKHEVSICDVGPYIGRGINGIQQKRS